MNEQNNSPEIEYFAAQKKIFPKNVTGRFRSLKWAIMVICLGVYYFTPLLRWTRPGDIPDQAILIDLPARRAYFFMIEIWPQEVYYLTGILILAAVALFFVTSLLGRVWCGYLCFQTVWTDLFVKVEHLIQGDRNARIKLDNGPLTFEKIWKKGLTHLVWLFIGFTTGGAFVFYFNDAPVLWNDIINFQVSSTIMAFVFGLTISTYIMAGFAREQVCTYMCPYARFQSAMFDRETLIIGYDKTRGETRGKSKGTNREGLGDCIDCSLCVQVCPTGIDIRNGLQMECIACGLCVDACDNVMEKIGKPKGLVRYDTEHNLELRAQGHNPELHLLRPRTVYYTILLLSVCGLMLASLLMRSPLEIHAIHDRNPLFVMMSDGTIRNGYDIKILNKAHEERHFTLTVSGIDNAQIELQGVEGASVQDMKVKPDSVGAFRVFVLAQDIKKPSSDIVFQVKDNISGVSDDVPSIFITKIGE